MSSNAAGILIIVAIVVIGILTGGSIFTGGDLPAKQSVSPTSGGIPNTTGTSGKKYNEMTPEERRKALNEEIRQVTLQIDELKAKIDKNIENQNASIYKDKIFISSVSKPGTLLGYVRLTSTSDIVGDISISGWKLRSSVTGSEEIIGGASNLPYPDNSLEKPLLLPRKSKVI